MPRIDQIKMFLQDNPDDPFLRFALAKEFESLEDWESARNEYRWLYTERPAYNGAYYHYAQLLIKQNEVPQALQVIEKGLAVCTQQQDLHAKSELQGLWDEWADD